MLSEALNVQLCCFAITVLHQRFGSCFYVWAQASITLQANMFLLPKSSVASLCLFLLM